MDDYSITGNILKSATKAGFSEKYARHQGKKILNTALRLQTQQLIDKSTNHAITAKEAKETMLDILGKDSMVLKDRLNKIAFEQDKDYSSALKILGVLSKETLGIDITQQDTQVVNVPVLNLTFNGVNNKGDNDAIRDI